MAPSLIEVEPPQSVALPAKSVSKGPSDYKEAFIAGPRGYNNDIETKGTAEHAPASYPNYLPVWDNETEKYPALAPFEHYDHGKDADLSFKDLLGGNAKVTGLTATIGAEVTGIQVSQLNNAGKDQLARFVAEKKIVAFRDQDFADLPIDQALSFGGYFGRHHIHPTSGAPKGYPQIHLVHRGADDTTAKDFFETRTNSVTWHSDVSYEKQPPGVNALGVESFSSRQQMGSIHVSLDGPTTGGDTLFLNQAEAYNRLSPEFRKRLHGLKAVHSGHEQASNSKDRGGVIRRDPITSVHPVIRTHPVTGERAIYVNPQFTRYIVGFKKEESDYLLKFLYDHMALSQDIQARVKWAPKTLVVWDNRVTCHSALLDWNDGQRRHLARITPQAEPPTEDFNANNGA